MIYHAALKTELTTDPAAMGYAPMVAKGDDAGPVTLLNAPAGSAFFRSDVTIHDIVGAVAPADFAALAALQIAKLQLLFAGVSTIDLSLATNRTILAGIFTGASAPTLTALVAMAKRAGSRAETLFGAGAVVTPTDVAVALRG
jgi:hypothetical protein